MASTYSTLLNLELIATGDQNGTWGVTTNTNIGTLIEQAIAGRAAVTHDDTANYTLTVNNGSTDEARQMILNIGGALTAARNVVCPTSSKLYVIKNATTGGYAVTLKTAAGTGISVPNGNAMILFCDGTNVVNAIDYFASISTGTITASGQITSTVATGSAPFVVASTTTVANLKAATAVLATTATDTASKTGTGSTYATNTSPTFVTPVLGVAAATSINFGQTALSFYEEGTWTPSPHGFTVTGAPTVTGTYTRIGRMVWARVVALAVTSYAGTGGSSFWSGLPYASSGYGVTSGANDSASPFGNGLITGTNFYPATFSAGASVNVIFVGTYIV